MKIERQSFVVQRLVNTHQINSQGRLGTWRTVTQQTSETEAIQQVQCMPTDNVYRLLCSPSVIEMQLGAEVTEWTI